MRTSECEFVVGLVVGGYVYEQTANDKLLWNGTLDHEREIQHKEMPESVYI